MKSNSESLAQWQWFWKGQLINWLLTQIALCAIHAFICFSHHAEPGQSEKSHIHCYWPSRQLQNVLMNTIWPWWLPSNINCLFQRPLYYLLEICLFIYLSPMNWNDSKQSHWKAKFLFYFIFSRAVTGYYGLLVSKIHLQFEEHLEILVAPNYITWRRDGWRQLKRLAAVQAVLKTSASFQLSSWDILLLT